MGLGVEECEDNNKNLRSIHILEIIFWMWADLSVLISKRWIKHVYVYEMLDYKSLKAAISRSRSYTDFNFSLCVARIHAQVASA